MTRKHLYIIIILLIVGVLFRLYITSEGLFIFHMDSARDYLDVREMVLFKKFRLIGPTSAIPGFYTGPGWYYLLSIPFMLTGGNPYASIILEIICWAIGGFFLMKLATPYGKLPMTLSGLLWILSNYMMLQTTYSFHPNMITLLTPVFIYLLNRYLANPTLLNSTLTFLLAGMFFQFEMNFGIFMVPIIVSAIFLSGRWEIIKKLSFWLGIVIFGASLLPQIIFDFKHSHMMSQGVVQYIRNSAQTRPQYSIVLHYRQQIISETFYSVLLPVFMNFKPLTIFMTFMGIVLFIIGAINRQLFKDRTVLITYLLILLPFICYILIPVSVNPWHLGAVVAASILLSSYILNKIFTLKGFGVIGKWILAGLILYISSINLISYVKERQSPGGNPSLMKHELAAIDYVYQEAAGKNFRVYSYLPSVYDYPYQYLFWWYGQRRYGYLPKEYSYAPNKPPYITGKELLLTSSPQDSDLVFLIKEPDDRQRRELWENNFTNYPLIKTYRLQSIEIETRKSPS